MPAEFTSTSGCWEASSPANHSATRAWSVTSSDATRDHRVGCRCAAGWPPPRADRVDGRRGVTRRPRARNSFASAYPSPEEPPVMIGVLAGLKCILGSMISLARSAGRSRARARAAAPWGDGRCRSRRGVRSDREARTTRATRGVDGVAPPPLDAAHGGLGQRFRGDEAPERTGEPSLVSCTAMGILVAGALHDRGLHPAGVEHAGRRAGARQLPAQGAPEDSAPAFAAA